MSKENVELVRQIYAAWGSGHSGRRFMSPDIEYVNPENAVEPGTRRGRDAFNLVFDVYESVRFEPERFIDAGDEVVMVGRMLGRARASGIEVAATQGHVWTVRSGRAVRMRWFNDPRQALEAAGMGG